MESGGQTSSGFSSIQRGKIVCMQIRDEQYELWEEEDEEKLFK